MLVEIAWIEFFLSKVSGFLAQKVMTTVITRFFFKETQVFPKAKVGNGCQGAVYPTSKILRYLSHYIPVLLQKQQNIFSSHTFYGYSF